MSYKKFLHVFRKQYLWISFLGILVCYSILIIPTLGRLGIGWDEATDFAIAQAYQTPRGLLLGHSWDPSQTRLPMFIGAFVFRILGVSNLLIARYTTVFIGALTLLGILVYGIIHFNSTTGILAAGLLAINPFFLAFARLAFTESDMYLACSLAWLLVVFSRFQKRPSFGWAVLSAVVLGLAVSSKATAIAIVPAACISFLLSRGFPVTSNETQKVNDLVSISPRFLWLLSGWATAIIFVGLLASKQIDVGAHPRIFHLLNYGFVSLSWLIMIAWGIRHKNFTTHSIALSAYVACICLLTFMIFPPEHLGNSRIIGALLTRANSEMTFMPGFIFELAALHISSILLKSTPILGFGLLAGLLISYTQWRRRELTLPLLIATTYFLVVLILPLGQVFYTIPLLPILSLLAADLLVRLWSKQRKALLALISFGLIWWGVEVKQSYPDYHLNGYQWVGERPFFGRSSIGYRSIVYTPSDGVQQAMEWLNEHAGPDQVAQLYVGPWHIVNSVAPDPIYEISNGREETLDVKPDFVVIHIGEIIWQGVGNDTPQDNIFRYPFDPAILYKDYEKVFVVQRAFNLEVASIWTRR